MSRTFRRKNYIAENQTSWDRAGSKIAGYFTECDYSVNCNGYLNRSYRAPTRQEYYEEYYRIHGEAHSGDWSPPKGCRNPRMRQNRNINKREIFKELFRADYEGKYEQNPRSCAWDWR